MFKSLKTSHVRGLLIVTATAMLLPTAAHTEVDEIVVTVTKREASIQDVAASVSQIGGEDLEIRGIDKIEALSLQIPNLTFGSNGSNAFVTLRGIGTTVDSGVSEPSVSTYVDGVFLPRMSMSVLRQTDLERVEVLRGPQGTLYGRNATGGAMNFISRKPSDEFEGSVKLSLENRSGYGVSGFVSGPITDKASFRLSLGKESQDGFVDVLNTGRELAETDVLYGRLALQLRPTEDLTIDLSVQHEDSDAANGYQLLLTPATGAFLPLANQTTRPNEVFADGPFEGDVKTTIASGIVNWDISDEVSLRSVTGYVDHEVLTSFDADSTDLFFVDLVRAFRPSESFSQEINLYGETDRVSWLVGAFYFRENFEILLPVEFIGIGPVLAGDIREETRSFALFADVTVAVTDRFRINGGLRFNSEDKDFEFFGGRAGDLDSDDVLPKLGLQFDLSENVMVYGQWQEGVKSGGHQIGLPSQFEGEEIESYELGIKAQLLEGRLMVSAAAFSYDYTDLQATTVIPPSVTLVQNADAEVEGFEGEVVYTPVENLTLNLGASFLDSEYTRLMSGDQTLPGAPVADLSGEDLIRAPRYTFNVGVDWYIPVDAGILEGVRLRADVFHTDDFKLNFFDYDATRQDSYTIGNLAVIFTDKSERYQVRAYVNNIGDEETLNQANYLATTGAFFGLYTEPRNYGISLTVNF